MELFEKSVRGETYGSSRSVYIRISACVFRSDMLIYEMFEVLTDEVFGGVGGSNYDFS